MPEAGNRFLNFVDRLLLMSRDESKASLVEKLAVSGKRVLFDMVGLGALNTIDSKQRCKDTDFVSVSINSQLALDLGASTIIALGIATANPAAIAGGFLLHAGMGLMREYFTDLNQKLNSSPPNAR